VVHRDIKPGNILIDRMGIVKVLDMGLARFFLDDTDDLTKKYDENVLGTADYLAPEQALQSHEADIRADIYSLGGTFYYCLTGKPPFSEGTVAQKLIWHQTRQPRSIRSIRPEVPEEIVAIIEKMMMKDKNARFQSPQEVADVLAPWTQTPIPPPPESEMPQFSLAARLNSHSGDSSMGSSKRTVHDTVPVPPSTPPRKNWQVEGGSGSGGTSTSPKPTTTGTPRPRPAANATDATIVAKKGSPVARAVETHAQSPVVQSTPPPAKNERSNPVIVTPAEPEVHEVTEKDLIEDLQTPNNGVVTTPQVEIAALTAFKQYLQSNPQMRWLLIAGAVLLPLSIVLAYLLFASGGKQPKGTRREPIRVAPGENALRLALAKAKAGDHFLLSGDINEANLSIDKPDLIIESEQGKRVIWKCPPKARADSKLLLIGSNATGFQLRGITLDGNQQTESLISLFGQCPGVKLEHLELRNSKKYGVWITNCEGTSDNPVSLVNVRFHTPKDGTAVRFDILKSLLASVKVNSHLSFKDCTFEGPGRKFTVANNSFLDLPTIDLPPGEVIEKVP
jgi:hypothetical protein